MWTMPRRNALVHTALMMAWALCISVVQANDPRTIEVPPVTITSIGTENGMLSEEAYYLRSGVEIPSGLGGYENEGFTAAIGTGDTIVVRIVAKEGTRFVVSKHPDSNASTVLAFNTAWQVGTWTSGKNSTPTVTFEGLIGPRPEESSLVAGVAKNARWISASMRANIPGLAAFTGITYTFTVENEVPRTDRTYGAVQSSTVPAILVDAYPLASQGDESVPLFQLLGFAAAPSTVSVTDATLVADGGSTTLVTLQARDASGTDIPLGGETVLLTSSLGSMSAVTDHGDGTYSATLTAPASAEDSVATVGATVNGAPIDTTVDVTLTAWQPEELTLSRAPVGDVDGEPWSVQPVVDLRDSNGEVVTVADAPVTLALVGGDDAVLTGTTTVTPVEGRATFEGVGLRGEAGESYVLEFRADDEVTGEDAIEPLRFTLASSLPAPTSVRAFASDGRAWLAFDDPAFDVANFEVRSNGGSWTPLDPPVTRSPILVPDLVNGETATLEVRAVQAETGRRGESAPAINVTPREQDAATGRVTLAAPEAESVEVDIDPATGITTVTFVVPLTHDGDSTLDGVWLDCCDSDDDSLGDVIVASIEPEGDAEGRIRRTRVGWYWQNANLVPGTSVRLRVQVTMGGNP